MQSNFFCNWSKISVLGFFPKTPNSFYNNTEIHWHVVKWPPIFPFKSVERKSCLQGLREGWQGQALHKKALPKLRPHLETAMLSTAELFMSDVAKVCSRSAKKRTAWRNWDAQKPSGRCNSEPKLGSFSFGALNGKGGWLVCLTLPRLAQEAPKSVLRGRVVTHKNGAADAIPNQNSVLLLLGPSRERGGCWGGCWGGGGARTNHELPHQARGHPFLYISSHFLLTCLTSLVTYLLTYLAY
jgi:hypothetical protein